jgi:hypothetical protein
MQVAVGNFAIYFSKMKLCSVIADFKNHGTFFQVDFGLGPHPGLKAIQRFNVRAAGVLLIVTSAKLDIAGFSPKKRTRSCGLASNFGHSLSRSLPTQQHGQSRV